jgi:hypothetical protein
MTLDPGLLESAARHRAATRDAPSAVGGFVLAVVVHLGVAAFALRAGAHEGNIARATDQAQQHPPEEDIIEGALLRQGGGGENFDPRTIHRQPPIRSEVAAAPTGGLAKNQNPTPPPNPNARRDPNALITGRDILGTGNQDLAEQLRNMAANESAAGTQPGPGDPDGSVNGTETDPARAGHGAQAKIRSFLERNIHLPANAPESARHTFVLGISISDDGSYIARAEVRDGSGDSFVDGDINGQLTQLVQERTPIPDLSDEEKAAIAGHSYRVRYEPR